MLNSKSPALTLLNPASLPHLAFGRQFSACGPKWRKPSLTFPLAAALALLFAGIFSAAQAQTTNWTGTTSTDFSVGTNWDNGVPAVGVTTVFDLGTGNIAIISSGPNTTGPLIVGQTTSGAANQLTIQGGGNVTSDSGTLGDQLGASGTVVVTGTGSHLFVNNTLDVGNSGNGTLTVSNGGNVTSGTGYLAQVAGSNGTATVDGANSTWNLGSSGLYVGDNGNGTLTISNGGSVTANFGDLGQTTGANGNATVTGANSTWKLGSADLFVGNAGNGTLTISNGGNVSSGTGDIGITATAQGNVTVTGANSTWLLGSYSLYVGYAGVGNLVIANGGNISSGVSAIAYSAGSTGNVTVDGTNSTWNMSASVLYVGFNGTGTLAITNGGSVSNGVGNIGYNSAGSGNVTVDGANSTWNLSASGLNVGFKGTGTLTISNGGYVTSGVGNLGSNATANGTVTVNGANSTWNLGGNSLYVGYSGIGNLAITNGGNVTTSGTDVGYNSGSNGTVTVDGANSTLHLTSTLYVGYSGNGTLTVSNGGNVSSNGGYVGDNTGSNGTATVDGANSTWNLNGGALDVPFIGHGTLTISNGGKVSSGAGHIAGYSSSTGIVTVDGANSTWTLGSFLYVGDYGNGTLTISNGGNVTGTSTAFIGTTTASTGTTTVNGAGSILHISSSLYVGGSGNGTLTVSNGGNVSSSQGDVGYQAGYNGTVLITGANSTWNAGSQVFVGDSGNGTLTVANGGTFITSIDGFLGESSGTRGAVTVDGANSTWNAGTGTLYIGDSGNGTLTISNGGNISSGSSYLGDYSGANGTVTVDGANSTWNMGTGALYVGNSGYGTMTVSNGGNVSSGSVYLGEGTSTNGTVTVDGANSTLDAGSGNIIVGAGQSSHGRLTVSNGGSVTSGNVSLADALGSTATVIVDGANSTWNDAGYFYVGNVGTVTLTISNGGSLSVTGPMLVDGYSGGGYGVVNLNSNGTLKIGGANGIEATSYSYGLNLGGGKIQVTGSDLTVSMNATLVASTSSTIDTGTFNATLSGYLSGSGSLVKLGTGNLVLTAANNYSGNTTIDGGSVELGQPGAKLNGTASIVVGNTNSANLDISNGGTVSSTGDSYLGEGIGSGGIVTVDGSSSKWGTGSGALYIGDAGNGTLTISNGGNVTGGGVGYLGYVSGSNATVTVDGTNSKWGLGTLYVGTATTGTLTITNGGNVSSSSAYLGGNSGSNGTVTVDGTNSKLSAGSGALDVGALGTGTLTVTNGAQVTSGSGSVGAGADANGTVLVTDAHTILNTGDYLLVGDGGTGNLTVSNTATVTVGANGTSLGVLDGSNGTVLVTNVNSTLNAGGSLQVGVAGTGNLTVVNGSNVTIGANVSSVGALAGGNGTLTVTGYDFSEDIGNETSTITPSMLLANGALVVGGSGNGTLTVSNAGYVIVNGSDSNGIGLSIGASANSTGTVTVTDYFYIEDDVNNIYNGENSELDVNGGAVVVGGAGNGTLTIANSGYINAMGADGANISLYVGNATGGNGTVVVTGGTYFGVGNYDSAVGAAVVGNNGTGNLTIAGATVNGASEVDINGFDANGVALTIGASANSTGTVTVTDYYGYNHSKLLLENGGLIVGGSGSGTLTLANGGELDVYGADVNGIGMYIGQNANSTGTVTVSDIYYYADGGYDIQSDLEVGGGALVVGGSGSGNLTVANGGYVDADGSDGNGVGMYVGQNANSTGNVTVTGVGNYGSGFQQSQLYINEGALLLGGDGNASLTISNGGSVQVQGSDSNSMAMYIGGNTAVNVTVADVVYDASDSRTYKSELDIREGALAVGYNNNGTLTISNGGYVYSDGSGDYRIGVALGYNAGVTGNMTVADVVNILGEDPIRSELTIEDGALAVGYNGTGTLTISNGGYVYADDYDDYDVGMSLGYNAGATGNVTVTGVEPNSGYQSELEVDYGTLVVGGSGNGTLTVANGGYVLSDDYDEDPIGLAIGLNTGSIGNVTVTGVEPNSGDPSELDVDKGALIVGYNGTGTLTMANGGYGNLTGTDYSNVALYLGYDANSTGNVTVTGFEPNSGDRSELDINSGATVVGGSGNGTLTVADGGNVFSDGSDSNRIGMYLGYNANSTGNVTVTDVANIDSNYTQSKLLVEGGAMVIGGNGTGNLLVANGGYVNLEGDDSNHIGQYIGYGANSTGNVTVTGVESNSGHQSELDFNDGVAAVGYDGMGSLTITNGGFTQASGYNDVNGFTLAIGYDANSTGNVIVTGVEPVSGDPSQLRVLEGALLVGYNGTGTLNISNGGYVLSDGYNTYIGYNAGSTGNVTVTGVEPISGYQSELEGDAGALVVGYNGTGTLTVANGGYVLADNSGENRVGVYLGENAGSTGNVTVTGVEPNSGDPSTLEVDYGATAVGYDGTGTLTIANGGYGNLSGTDRNGFGAYIGYDNGSIGSILVTDPGSALNITTGALAVNWNGGSNSSLIIANGGVVNVSGNDSNGNDYGFGAAVAGNLTITGANSALNVTTGDLYFWGGSLTIANGGAVNVSGNDGYSGGNGIGMYVDAENGANITALVTDPGSILSVTTGALDVSVNDSGNVSSLTVANGGEVSISGNDGSVSLYLGSQSGSNGNLLVTDPGSLLLVEYDNGDYTGAVIVGDAGQGNLTVANGGNATFDTYDRDGTTLAIGRSSGGNGAVLVTGANSSLNLIDGEYATVIGGDGNGTLTVANGGYFYNSGWDDNNIAIYLGENTTGNGTLTVTDAGSSMLVDEGTVVVGYDGNGTMNIANGGAVDISAVSGGGYGLILGYDPSGIGNMTVSDVEPNSGNQSMLTVENGTTVVGYDGLGNLTIANGGYGNLSGTDDSNITLYLGYDANSTGNVTVTGVEPNSDDQSEMDVYSGALVVGGSGNGTLTVANGGYVYSDGSDSNGIGLYLGYNANSTGIVTVTDVEPNSGDQSQLYVGYGALVVGYNGTGMLTVANGGYVYADDSDSNDIGMYLGYNAGSTGNVTVTGVEPNSGYQSKLEVDWGTLVVGGSGNGTLTVANGGYVLSDDFDHDAIGLILGLNANSTGNVTVTDVEPNSGNQSTLEVDDGATVVGYDGAGNLTIANGGWGNFSGYDTNETGLNLGYDSGSTGNVTVTGVESNSGDQSTLEDGKGAAVVGYDGTGNLTIANGGWGNFSGYDSNFIGLYLGYDANSTGNVLVTGVEPNSGYPSELDVNSGAMVVGNNGTGSLTVANGGYVNAASFDANWVGFYAGVNANSTATVTVTDVANIDSSYIPSELLVDDGALDIGYNGNSTLTVSNGGFVYADRYDHNDVGMNIGYGANSTGTVTVSGVEPASGDASNLTVGDGALVVGYNGTGTLTVANGGVVSAYYSISLGVNAGSSGVVNLDTNGTLAVSGTDGIAAGTGSYTFTMDGGKIQVLDSDLTTSLNITLNATHSLPDIFDTNGDNATFSGILSGNGILKKIGAGILYLTADNTYTGGTVIGGGLINIATLSNLGSGSVTLSGGGLQLAPDSSIDLSSIINTLGAGNDTFDTNGDDVTFVNAISGTGVFVKDGSGNLTLAANETFTGGTTVLDGTLIVDGNLGNATSSSGNLTVGDAFATMSIVNGASAHVDNITLNNGNLTIASAARVSANDSLTVGEDGSNTSVLLVTDANSTLNVAGYAVVGDNGLGSLTIANGAVVDISGNDFSGALNNGVGVYAGYNDTGIISVSNTNSTLKITDGKLALGWYGAGNLTIANGGNVAVTGSDGDGVGIDLGYEPDASGNVYVTGPGSQLSSVGSVRVGAYGTGNFTVANGGNVTVSGTDIGSNAFILDGANSTALVTGAGSVLNINAGALNLYSGTNSLTIANGGVVNASGNDTAESGPDNGVGAYVGYGSEATSTLLVTDANSTLNVTDGALVVGYDGNGTLTVSNGGEVNLDNGYDLTLGQNAESNGTFNLDSGGIVQIGANGAINSGAGSAAFNLNGGTLRAGGDFSANVDFSLHSNSTIDSNGHTATVNSGINGTGNLTTTGSGSVILNGNSAYPATTVSGGNLVVNAVLASNITVSGTGAVLGGGGTVNGDVLVNIGGISPGIANTVTENQASAFSNLTINGNLALNVTSATLVWHLNSGNATTTSDFLHVLGNLTTGTQSSTTIIFDFSGTGYFDGVNPTTYTLLTADNDLSSAGFTFEAVDAGPSDITSSNFLFANGGTTLEFALVPEPATWGLLLGGATLLLGLRRKRRRKV